MFPFQTIEIAFRRFQTRREPRALAMVFDRTAPELLVLARHLAPPGTEAEDLVQATFVTAIEAADSHRPGERVLPWLCGVLANHARVARRRGRRVVDPQRLPHAVADASLDAESSELRSELQAAIDRLPEVYRPVLRLVFEHGLQAQEVARALERPAGTVRAQVTRGLELLRRTLPATLAGGVAIAVGTGRGLAAVRQTVLGRVGGTGLGAVSPLFIGGLLVLHHKLFAAGAAVLFATLGLFWLVHEPPRAVTVAGARALPPASASSSPIERNLPEAERTLAAVATEPPGVTPEQPEADAARLGGHVVVHVRDAGHAAVAGVQVALFPFAELQDLGRRMDFVATDANGDAHFHSLRDEDWAIEVDRVGLGGMIRSVTGSTVEREVSLARGIRVEGRVVDGSGASVAGANIVLHGSRATLVPLTRSAADGSFVVEHVPGGVHLQARAKERAPSLAHPIRGARDGTQQLRLVVGALASSRIVRGLVRDADGRAVADATVAILPTAARDVQAFDASQPMVLAAWLRTDAEGRFAADDVGAGQQLVVARALPNAPAWVEVDTAAGEAFAQVQLPRGSSILGVVHRAEQAIAGANVLAWPLTDPRIGYLQNLFGMRQAITAADGAFRIDGLLAGAHSLRLVQDGAQVLRQQQVDRADGETMTWNVDLRAGPSLRIAVQSDATLAGLRLVALVSRSELVDGEAPSFVPMQANGEGVFEGARDTAVDVELCHMPGGNGFVKLAAVRSVAPSQTDVQFQLRAEQVPLRSITGRLVDDRRAPVAQATISATRNDASGLFARLEGTTGSDGTFRLGPLPSGDYQLVAQVGPRPDVVGNAVLTLERDEAVGDLVLPPR
jgi:RNA polymerase sigma-70 factor (ECF subfamily)